MGTITKAPIGVEDLNLKTSGTTRQTFTRNDSTGRPITLNQVDAGDLQLRTVAQSVEDAIIAIEDVIVIHVNTLDELKLFAIANISDGQLFDVKGYDTIGDGSLGQFYWDSTSTDTPNDVTIVQVTGVATGRLLRLYDGNIIATWGGVLATNSEAQNKAALDTLIAVVDDIGGGTIIVTSNVNYGYDRDDLTSFPDFSGTTNDMLVEDYSIAEAFTPPAKPGQQVRFFYNTPQTTPAGQHNGNGQLIRSDWAPYLFIMNDANLAAQGQPSRTADDNRRATVFFGNDGIATWGVGQGAKSGDLTEAQLSSFKIVGNVNDTLTSILLINFTADYEIAWNSDLITGVHYLYGGREDATLVTRHNAIASNNFEFQYSEGGTVRSRLRFYPSGKITIVNPNERITFTEDNEIFGFLKFIEELTGGAALDDSDSNKLIANTGAGGGLVVTLPAATAGLTYESIITSANNLRFTPDGTDFFRGYDGITFSTKAAGKYMESSTAGSRVELICIDAGVWEFKRLGTWTDEA